MQKTIDELQKRNGSLEKELSLLRKELEMLRVQVVHRGADITEKTRHRTVVLLEGLTENQHSALQELRRLPENAFAEAKKIMATLARQPFTEAFAKSFASVLNEKRWSVVCGECGAPSKVYWNRDPRYKQNGRAAYSHHGEGRKFQHGSLVIIPEFTFVQRIDKRLKKKNLDE